MATRYIRKTVILAKPEVTNGTDVVPTGAANAIKVFDVSISPLEIKGVALDYITGWFGSAMNLPGAVSTKMTFSTSLSGAGLAATAPAWGNLLLGCAAAETTGLTAPNRVEYLPATDTLKSLSIYWADDGVLHKALGCMGNVKLSSKAGEMGKFTWDFIGVEVDPTASANPVPTLTAWQPPVAIVKANVTDILLGCTYAAGALSGGTSYNSSGITADWGNTVSFSPTLSAEEVVINNRKVKGTTSLQLSAAQEVTLFAAVKAGSTQGMGFVIGNTSGNKIMLHAPALRLTSYKKEELDGKRMIGFDWELDPVAGNDELRIISL
jgi:hypothetical protein